MDFLSSHLLSVILFFPVFAAILILFLPKGEDKLVRWTALIASLVPFVLTVVLWLNFDASASSVFQFEESYIWYAAINSNFHLGVDGISLSMVLLTTLLTPLAILASFSIKEKVKAYMMLFLFLEMGMLGVFMSMDLLIFFVFWGNWSCPDVFPHQPMGFIKPQLCLPQVHDLHSRWIPGLAAGDPIAGCFFWNLRYRRADFTF